MSRCGPAGGVRGALNAPLAALVATSALALAAGCTTTPAEAPATEPPPAPASSPSTSPQPVTLRFAVYGGDDELAAYDELAEAYTKDHPNVTVRMQHAPDAEASMNRLTRQFARHDGPDVFLAPHDQVPELVDEGAVRPVNELLQERKVDFGDGYQRDALEAFSADSALQCMPNDVSPLVVYYNQSLVDFGVLAGPDEAPVTAEDGWSWEQFATLARDAARGGATGFYIAPTIEQLAPFIWSAGGELVDDFRDPTSLSLSDGDSASALVKVLELVRDPGLTPTPDELAEQDAVARFADGKIAMILGTRALTPRLREAQGLDFEVFPLPSIGRFRTILAMSGYCISAQSGKISAAADFIAFAVGREGATIVATAGFTVPANLEVAHSPAFIQPGTQPDNLFVFNESVRRAEPTPFVSAWPRVKDAARPYLQRLFYAPVIDLDATLMSLDTRSQALFGPPPSGSPRASAGAAGAMPGRRTGRVPARRG